MDIANFFGLAPILMNEADGGDGAGGGSAVATVETSLATGSDGGDHGGEETALTTTDGTGTQGDGTVARKGSPARDVLRAHADPQVQKYWDTSNRAIAFRNDIGKMFPGGNPKTAIESLHRDMVGLAGRNWNTPDPQDPTRRTGLQQVRDRLAEIEEIDLMFYGGNPQLLDGMTSDDEGKAAFAKLAPHMLSKWREIAPNAYSAMFARQILADLKSAQLSNEKGEVVDEADIPRRIHRISLALGKDGAPSEFDLKMARNELAYVAAYLYQLTATTNLAPEVFAKPGDAADSKLAERERKLAEREAQSRNAEWSHSRQITANQLTTKTWNQLTKGHKVSADDQEECIALFQRRFDAKIKVHEPHADDSRRGYIESQDRDGYLAYENYLMTTYGVPALKEQVSRMLAKMQPAKPGQQRTEEPAAPGQAQTERPSPGFFKLSARPPLHVINNDGRTKEMIMAKQARLRIPWEGHAAGKKVCW